MRLASVGSFRASLGLAGKLTPLDQKLAPLDINKLLYGPSSDSLNYSGQKLTTL